MRYIFWAALVLSLLGTNVHDAEADPIRKEQLDGYVARFLQSRQSEHVLEKGEIARAAELLLDDLSLDEMHELRRHSDDTLAILVAWNCFQRSISFPALTPSSRNEGVRIESHETYRFLGYMEGRCGISPPRAWEQCLVKGVFFDVGAHHFDVGLYKPRRNRAESSEFASILQDNEDEGRLWLATPTRRIPLSRALYTRMTDDCVPYENLCQPGR